MILLDTHVLVWFDEGNAKLGRRARRLVDSELRLGKIAVSVISFWEIGIFTAKGRMTTYEPVSETRRRTLDLGIIELQVDGEIAVAAASFGSLHGDPADRFIVATAVERGAILVTGDARILDWRGPLKTLDARR